MTLLRCLFILACCGIVPAQAQTSGQGASGLNVTSLKVKEKRIGGYSRASTVYPPKINPTLGRGTRDRTDSPEIASLKEIREDGQQRQRDLRALDVRSRNSARSRPSRAYQGYEIRARIANEGPRSITKLVWAYRPTRNSQVVLEKQFYCHLPIAPGQSRNVKVWFPAQVLNVAFTNPRQSSVSDIVIEQVEYDGGTGWRLPTTVQPPTPRTLPPVGKGKCAAF
ncbi:MAG TPA: hypothetical protein VFX97_10590 [Pyrinomonadaceae bacterium]|nr:hypothetical protein [Pyrinomonadaceae bacterium]